MPRTRFGRPSRLTPELRARILQSMLGGAPGEVAAEAAGIDRSTYYRWRQLGRTQRRGKYRDFWDATRAREAEVELACVVSVRRAAIDNWQAAAWLLERRHPERWGRKDRIDLVLREQAEKLAAIIDGVSADELVGEAERMVAERDYD